MIFLTLDTGACADDDDVDANFPALDDVHPKGAYPGGSGIIVFLTQKGAVRTRRHSWGSEGRHVNSLGNDAHGFLEWSNVCCFVCLAVDDGEDEHDEHDAAKTNECAPHAIFGWTRVNYVLFSCFGARGREKKLDKTARSLTR